MPLISCPECHNDVSDEALSCPHCGYRIAPPEPKWHRGIAVLLSVLIPGGGQLYKGDVISGIFWLLFTSFFYGLFLPAGFILHMGSVVVAAMGDPTR